MMLELYVSMMHIFIFNVLPFTLHVYYILS